MSLAGLLARGRAAAEALMVDAGTAKRATGVMAQDPVTGAEAPVYTTLFSSRCKVQARQLVARAEEAGGRTAVTMRLELHLPVGSDDLLAGDVFDVTAVGAGSVTRLGRRLRISGPVDKTFPTALRYEVTEVVA